MRCRRKIRLCIDARMLFSSGIGTYLRNILQGLSCVENLDITLIRSKKEPSFLSFPVVFCDAPVYSLQEQIQLLKIIPPCDLFWSPHYNVPLGSIPAKKRIVTIHDVCHLSMKDCFPWWKRLPSQYLLQKAIDLSDAVCTVSSFSYQEILRRLVVCPEKMHLISGGVDASFFSCSLKKAKEVAIQRWGLIDPYILFVGSHRPHKNLTRLVEAFRQLQGVDLVLVGANLKQKRIRNLPSLSDEELCWVYGAASLLAMPSLYEGFGLPPLEAMSAGCPVVVAREASLPEICGPAAYYVDPYSVASIHEGLQTVLSNDLLRRQLILAGKERVLQFSWKQTVQKMVDLFDRILIEED